jgi:hypothetical protein
VWTGAGEKPQIPDLARDGMWALRSGGSLRPRPSAIEASILPANVLELFRRAFEDGARDPGQRPSAAEWRDALSDLGSRLGQCTRDPGHFYVSTLGACPWCRHQSSRAAQSPLPPSRPPPVMPPPGRPGWHPPYPGTPRRRFRAGPIAVGLGVAIALIGGGGTAIRQLGGDSGGTGGSQSTQSTQTGEAGGTGTDTDVPDAGGQAAAVRDLLSSSGDARRSIQPAIADVSACGDLSADAAVFDAAATSRSEHRSQADALDYAALPDGAELRQSLVDALTASYQADVAFREWAESLDGNCTSRAARTSGHRKDAADYSKTATAHKKRFVALWNPICESYGWSSLQYTDI